MRNDEWTELRAIPRLRDVAQLAHVAISTASRALASPDRVNPETRLRVLTAAKQIGYPLRRIPPESSTGAVAVLVSDITNPFFFDIIRSTQQSLAELDLAQIVVDTGDAGASEFAHVHGFLPRVDGFIFTASRLSDLVLANVAALKPAVLVNRELPGSSSVVIDSARGIQQAVDHLADLGHERILYAAGPRNSTSEPPRQRAVIERGRHRGLTVFRTDPLPARQESGAAAAEELVSSGATGCIAFNDLIAIGTMRALQERGIHVPRQVSVIGCDDVYGADFCNPALSTVTSPLRTSGRVAVGLLHTLLRQPPRFQPETVSLPTQLRIRASTASPHRFP